MKELSATCVSRAVGNSALRACRLSTQDVSVCVRAAHCSGRRTRICPRLFRRHGCWRMRRAHLHRRVWRQCSNNWRSLVVWRSDKALTVYVPGRIYAVHWPGDTIFCSADTHCAVNLRRGLVDNAPCTLGRRRGTTLMAVVYHCFSGAGALLCIILPLTNVLVLCWISLLRGGTEIGDPSGQAC